MWEAVATIGLLAAALAFCVMVMAFHVQRMARMQEGLIDRLMATDWPSYEGYVLHQQQAGATYWQRMPKPEPVKAKPAKPPPEQEEYDLLSEADQQAGEPAETIAEFR